MPFINFPAREVNCKIVFYGPGLGGKTTNIQYIYQKTNPNARGKLITLDTDTDRTLFFDFLPLSLGDIRGYRTRFFLYTVPGQVFYEATRKLVLKGADGVVFVADSQTERMDANLESMDDMHRNLREHGLEPGDPLAGSLFPQVWPHALEPEVARRLEGPDPPSPKAMGDFFRHLKESGFGPKGDQRSIFN